MNEANGHSGVQTVERRRSHRLRSVFDTAYSMVEPFFDPATGWVGPSLAHLTFRVVRENFTELTSEEVHSLVVAAHRTYIDRNPDGSDHLPRPGELRQLLFQFPAFRRE